MDNWYDLEVDNKNLMIEPQETLMVVLREARKRENIIAKKQQKKLGI